MHLDLRWRAAALIIVAATAPLGLPPGGARAQQPPPVDVATPLAREVVEYDVYTGRFEAADRVEIRSQVSGYLDKVGFEDGQIVSNGALLFVIDQRTFRAEISRAQANVAAAEATRTLARIELDRATQLAARNVGTTQDVDRTTATLAGAEASLAVAEAELRQAQLNLDFTEIRAPITGQMSNRKVDPGNLVVGGTNNATLLSTIVSIDPIHFVFTASEADFLRYSRLAGTGDRLAGLSAPFQVDVRLMDEDEFVHVGALDFVDNQLDPNSGTIVARALLPNADRFLVPGTFGRIRLPGSGAFEALLIPDEAVIADQARKIVLTVDAEGTVSPRPVQLGGLHKGLRVVKGGLAPDDRVIVAGIQRARPGAKVTPQEVPLKIEGE
jgi:RND family efflux transporter MFP subunit